MIKMLDTFAGVGGFHIGAKKVFGESIEIVGAVEFNDTCQKTYESNFGIKPLGDITKIDPKDLPDFDILTGGFPCQPFSRNGRHYNNNGKTLGDDDRADLFLNLVAILQEKKPKFFVFENVREIKTIKAPDGSLFFDTLIHFLEDSGYAVYHETLSPHQFGVPQQRNRVFFVGIRKDLDKGYEFPKPFVSNCSMLDILEEDVHSRFDIEFIWKGRKNMRLEGTRLDAIKQALESGRWEEPVSPTGKISPLAIIYGDTPSGGPRQQDKVYSPYGISPTLTTFAMVAPVIKIGDRIRQITPREAFRLQSFPDTFLLPDSDNAAFKQAGNAVNCEVVARVFEKLALIYFQQKTPK